MGLFSIIALVVAVVAGVTSYTKAKKAQSAAEKGGNEGILITKQDNNAGLKLIYGERRVGGTKVFKDISRLAVVPGGGRTVIGQNSGGVDATRDHAKVRIFLDRVDVIGDGPIHSVTGIEIDGDEYQHERFDNRRSHSSYRAIVMDGTAGQTWLSELGTVYSRWKSTAVGEGVAYVQSRFRAQANFQTYQGEPLVQYQVKGKLIYDPRKDTVYGGVGSHDATDSTTWEWSDNPALCLLDYLTNDYGRGLSMAEMNVPTFVSAADSCDVTVTIPAKLTNTTGVTYDRYDRFLGITVPLPNLDPIPDYRLAQVGTTQKRLTCNVVLDPSNEVISNVQTLLDSMKGNLPYHQGKYSLRLEDSGTSIMALTEDDIVGGISFGDGDQSERFNRVTVKFPNREKRFNTDQVSWPKIGSSDYTTYLAEDQAQELWHEVEVSAVTDFYQAEDIAEFIVRNSRAALSCEIKVKSKGLLLEPSDIITVTHSTPGWTTKNFRVRGIKIGSDFSCTLSLQEYQASVYTWSTTSNEPDSPDTYLPRPTDTLPALTGLAATVTRVDSAEGTPHGIVTLTWNPVFDFEVEEYTLRYKQTTETVFQTMSYPETTRVTGVDPSLSFTAPQHNVTYDIYLNYFTTTMGHRSDVVTTTIVIPEYRSDLDLEVHDVELETGGSVTNESGIPINIADVSDLATYTRTREIEVDADIVTSQAAVQSNLDTEIARVDATAADLQTTLTDLTIATADVYVQASAPVAGVGGVPDPIADNSRWYDSDDANHPYAWISSAWTSLVDSRIGANAASIISLGVELDVAESDIVANATTTSALDATVVGVDARVTTNASSISTLTVDLDAAEVTILGHTGDISTNASAATALTTRVTAAEGTITTHSTDLTSLRTDLTTAEGDITSNTSAATALTTRVTTAEGSITSQGSSITTLQTELDAAEAGVTTNASGLSGLTTRVTAAEGSVTTNATDISTLTVDLDAAEVTILSNTGSISTNASATTALTTRVTTAEGSISTNSTSITSLGVDLDAAEVTILSNTGSLTTNTSAISGLDTRITTAEGTITTQATDLTTLNAELQFETELEDESGTTLQAESAVDFELEHDPGAILVAASDTSRLLDARVTVSESDIVTSAADITALEATVDNPTTGVSANATAIDATELRLDTTEAATTVNATDITALEVTVNAAGTGVTATATALDAVELTVNDATDGVSALATRAAALEATVDSPTTGVSANATAIDATELRLDTTETATTTNATDIAALELTVNNATTGVSANATAIDATELRLDTTEAATTVNATDVAALELTVNDGTTGVSANATAIDATELRLDITEAATTVNATDVDALEATVNAGGTGVAATASALDVVELLVNDATDGVTALAVRATTLETTVDDPTTGLSSRVTVTEGYGTRIDTVDGEIDNLEAEYFVRLDVNGNVSGFGLVNSGTSNEFKILADKFTIIDPLVPAGASQGAPFSVSQGVTSMQNVTIAGSLIVDDTITADKVQVTDLSAISANLGTVTAGTLQTATSGYRVEISDTGDFPIWYGIGAKTAENGLFYVETDGSVTINAVVNSQPGSSLLTLDVEAALPRVDGFSTVPSVLTSVAGNLNYTYTSGVGPYTYAWTLSAVLSGPDITISDAAIEKPTFSGTIPLDETCVTEWQVKVTDTITGAIFREPVLVSFFNLNINPGFNGY